MRRDLHFPDVPQNRVRSLSSVLRNLFNLKWLYMLFKFSDTVFKNALGTPWRAGVVILHKTMGKRDLEKPVVSFQSGLLEGCCSIRALCEAMGLQLWAERVNFQVHRELCLLIFSYSFVIIGTSDSLLINWAARGRWRHSILIIPVSNVCIISLFN